MTCSAPLQQVLDETFTNCNLIYGVNPERDQSVIIGRYRSPRPAGKQIASLSDEEHGRRSLFLCCTFGDDSQSVTPTNRKSLKYHMSNLRYAGIGSRETPKALRQLIADIAYHIGYEMNGILVSGGADGADSFFEEGCDAAGGKKEIWLPHPGFNKRKSMLLPSKDAFIVAERYVPHWKHCGTFARQAHARNCHQVLGENLLTPVYFVICWTPKGEMVGGTATALRVAEDYGIPVLNLGSKEWSVDEISFFLEVHGTWPQ